jgi:hypothetical protein
VRERADAHAQRLHPHEVDLLRKQPARIVFAKAGRLHEREGFELEGIGGERRPGLRKHGVSGVKGSAAGAGAPT